MQKFLVFQALVNLPESYKADWIDMMRIFRLGTDATPMFPAGEQATWVDPLSGQSYVAHRYGSETIDGAPVDRGTAYRLLTAEDRPAAPTRNARQDERLAVSYQ